MGSKLRNIGDFGVSLSTGFAMFSMFFGAGNLVFPLTIGAEVGSYYPIAMLGFLIAGVLVPFFGFLALIVCKGSYENFFAVLGKYGSFLIPLALMLLIGPFGATPRAITVAYGSLLTLFPDINVYVYSTITGLIIYWLVHDRTQLVENIGNYLTPILLLSLACIIFMGIYYSDETQTAWNLSMEMSFVHGFHEGYQTMDLLATYFFAIILIGYIRVKVHEGSTESQLNRLIFQALCIGVFFLSVVYISLIYLGAHYADEVLQSTPDQALSIIAHHIMGPYAAPIVCVAYIMACLTTAIALVSAFSEFIYENVFLERIPMQVCIIVTICLSCLISTLRFTGIAEYLGPIVQAMYPGLIVVTLLTLLKRYFVFPYTKQLFYFIFIANILYVLSTNFF